MRPARSEMASDDSTLPPSQDGSARPKSRKRRAKDAGTSDRRKSGKRSAPRLVRVPLKQIRLSRESDGAHRALDPLPVRGISEKHAVLMSMITLPVLIEDKVDPSIFHVLAREPIVRWIKAWDEAHDLALDTIAALVVNDLGVTPEEARLVEDYLLPLALGLLNREGERAARRALSEGGIPPPRKRSRREQLKPLTARREAGLEDR